MECGVVFVLKLIVLVGMFLVIGIDGYASQPLPTRTGDYCKDDALDYVADKGWNLIRMKALGWGGKDKLRAYWIEIQACTGYIILELNQPKSDCTMAHYWRRSNFMSRVYAMGDCKRLVPRDEFL